VGGLKKLKQPLVKDKINPFGFNPGHRSLRVTLPIGMALQLGASFSGDKTQLVPLLKAAITHHGAAFIVISPCVAFYQLSAINFTLPRAIINDGAGPAHPFELHPSADS